MMWNQEEEKKTKVSKSLGQISLPTCPRMNQELLSEISLPNRIGHVPTPTSSLVEKRLDHVRLILEDIES